MHEEAEKHSNTSTVEVNELQGLAYIFWADQHALAHASASMDTGQFAALLEEICRWLLGHLADGTVTVAPVTLDGQAVQQSLNALLTCLRGMVPKESPRQDPPRAFSPHSEADDRDARRRGRKKPEVAIFTFGRFTICSGGQEMELPGRHGDTLSKVLLCQPGRRASYPWLIDQIWPLSDGDRAIEYLYAAARNFRTATSSDLLLTQRQTQSYALAGQDRLWVDADAALSLIAEAETLGRGTRASLPLLEQAVRYFRRGRFLAGVEEPWVQARRLHLEMMKERALLALAETYRQQGKRQQAQMVLSEALAEDSTNENLLRALMLTLHEEGMTYQALRAYEEFARTQRRVQMEPAEATTALYKQLKRAPQVFDLAPLTRSAPLSLPHAPSSEKLSAAMPAPDSSDLAEPSPVSNDGEGSAVLMRSRRSEAGIVPAGENAVPASQVTDERLASSLPGIGFGLILWNMRPK